MKTKTIKAVISKKFNEWINSIDDSTVKNAVAENTIITGGSIASLLQNERPKDYDLYFRDKATTKLVAEYYVKKWNADHGAVENNIGNSERLFVLDGADVEAWKSGTKLITSFCPNHEHEIAYSGEGCQVSHMILNTSAERIKIIYPSDGVIRDPEHNPTENEMADSLDDLSEIEDQEPEPAPAEPKGKYRPVFFTTNAVTLSDKIQIIIRFYGEPDEIHENYDFEHCCCYWDSKHGALSTPEKALLAIMNKDLFYRGSKYPICSIIRSRKFINRGWKINAGQYLKMAFQISELDLTDIDVLEDQLVGIDTVYFMQAVQALRAHQEKDPTWQFDGTYLAAIIDRIF